MFYAIKQKKGFTLLELLVVIGIIMILSSALLGGLRTAREKARRAKCVSNLRQIGIAIHSYASDNNEQFPAALQDLVTGGYIDDARLFICPSNPGAENGYAYTAGLSETSPSTAVIAQDNSGNHKGGGNTLFVGGHVEWQSG